MNKEHFVSVASKGLVLNLDFFQEEKSGFPLNIKLDYASQNQSWETETVGVWVNIKDIGNFRNLMSNLSSGALFDIHGRELLNIVKDGDNFSLVLSSLENDASSVEETFKLTAQVEESFVRDLTEALSFYSPTVPE